MSEYTQTAKQIEDGFAHEPEYEYHDPINYGAHVQGNRRAFRRWLAEVERAAAEKAWDEGEQAGYEDALGEQRGIGPAESARNPYRRNEGENE